MLETILFLYFLLAKPAQPSVLGASSVALSSHTISMNDRYDVPSVNTVFKDNILLAMAYMDGNVTAKTNLDWNKVEEPFHYEFTLKPGEEFAFHDNTLPAYTNNIVKTSGSHYVSFEGYKGDGWIVGDGVCHLASLINWSAQDAGLDVYVPTLHSFAKINDIPAQYGVSINSGKAYGNLYITNNKDVPVTFAFDYDGNNLTSSVLETE